LLDDEGRFIGMVTSDQPPYGRAIDIDAVLDQVKRWGYPVELDTVERRLTSTLLHLAAKNGNKKEVKHLLENCANPNALDEKYETPLHIAVREGHIEVIPLLLKAGADKERTGQNLMRPLNIAIQTNRIDIVNLLLKDGASPKGLFGIDFSRWPIATAIDSCNFPIIDILLAAGVDINDTDETGQGVLYHALFKKVKLIAIKKLLSAGANPNSNNEIDVRESPLGYAIRTVNIEAMQLLVEAGANINAKDKEGNTPLSYALKQRTKKAVDWFRAHGAKE
jgi:ankyrin repeat protein